MTKAKKSMKRKVQDSIFTNMFREKKYLCRLVKSLHPEMDVTENDIQDETLECILANGIYNDLGFTVKGKVIILVEAQSTWTLNILPRMLFYLAETYKNVLQDKNLYGTKTIEMPEAELYVIYTGDKNDVPDEISLAKDVFKNPDANIDLRAKVITEANSYDIIKEYIICAKIFKEQVEKYGYTEKAIVEAINICKNKDVLKEYLETRETEVVDMMSFLFDQDTVTKNYARELANESYARAKAESERAMATMMADMEKLRNENARLKATH